MRNERRTVAVVGGGTAGSAAALLLAADGHAVTLFEAVADPAPVGAGLMLQPTGLAVLAQLGLLEQVVSRGAQVARLRALTTRGRTVLDLEYAKVQPTAFGLGIHRGVLFNALFGAVQQSGEIDVRCGVRVDELRRVGEQTDVLAAGVNHGAFDLVVVADGARSTLRDASGLVTRATRYPWGALWAILPDHAGAFGPELYQVLDGTSVMLGFLPTGQGPEARPEATGRSDVPLVSVFWSIRGDRVDAWRAEGLDAWRDRVVSLEPRAAQLLAPLTHCDDLLFAAYRDVVMSPWHDATRGVVFLGDAAHATSPQLGQGANLALCDAAALALAVAQQPTIRGALASYTEARRAHLNYYQWATRALTPFFQSDLAPLGWVRDALMGLACQLPFSSTKMIRTMCGLERGIVLGRPLAFPTLPLAQLPPGDRPTA